MPIDISYIDEDNYLKVTVSGDATDLQDALKSVRSIAEYAKEQPHRKIMIDIRALVRPEYQSERLRIGEFVAQHLPPPFKLAVVYPEGLMDRFTENVVVNRGGDAIAFANIKDAEQWLMS